MPAVQGGKRAVMGAPRGWRGAWRAALLAAALLGVAAGRPEEAAQLLAFKVRRWGSLARETAPRGATACAAGPARPRLLQRL